MISACTYIFSLFFEYLQAFAAFFNLYSQASSIFFFFILQAISAYIAWFARILPFFFSKETLL
jgi:hypothetical protein